VRREPLDALEIDGEALLLLPPDQVVRLSPIATTIFEEAAHGMSQDALATVVEERFGRPADGGTVDALRGILDGLVAAGVLERVARTPDMVRKFVQGDRVV